MPESLSTQHLGRRTHPGVAVDATATLVLVHHCLNIEARIVDLSLDGCLLQAVRVFHVPASARVEVRFAVQGLPFRLGGVAQWTDGKHLVDVQFAEMSSRRRDELAELLAELQADQEAAKSVPAADKLPEATQIERPANDKSSVAKRAEEPLNGPRGPEMKPEMKPETKPVAANAVASAPAAQPPMRERRTQARHSVDTKATILLVDVGSKETGRIVDVSLNGCRIHTDQRFPVGIYRRVEVEFVLDGLPFRLGGVTQSLHDKHTVGIRLLDLSERKREQLMQVIEEIDDRRRQKNPHGEEQNCAAS
jgi:hypothetical protein